MGTIFIRTIIIYTLVLIAIRLMGKREIGQLQPYELVVTIMIADVASLPMQNVSIPLVQGIVPILGLLFAQIVASLLIFKSKLFHKYVTGSPSVLVANGKIVEKNMKKQKYTLKELLEQIRVSGYPNLLDLDYVILETSGQISVIPKAEKQVVTIQDMKIQPKYSGFTRTIIIDGVFIETNLRELGKDKNWLDEQLKRFKLDIKNTLLFTSDELGNVYCQGKEDRK